MGNYKLWGVLVNKFLLSILILIVANTVSADATKKSKIKRVLYNGQADYTFFISESGWDASDSEGNVLCTPYYVQVTSGVLGRDKLLSLGLAAKMAGMEVDFIGECDANPNYFNAHYIRVY